MTTLETVALMAAIIHAGDRMAAETHNSSAKVGYEEIDRGQSLLQCVKDAEALLDIAQQREEAREARV